MLLPLFDRAEEQGSGLSLTRSPSGMWMLHGDLDPITGRWLADTLDSVMDDVTPGDDRSPEQRRADALVEILEMCLGELLPPP